MKRTLGIALALIFAGAGSLHAQMGMGNGQMMGVAANMKGSWTNISDLLQKMAEKMPAEEYRFKATPELQDFGTRMAHAVTFMMRGCAAVKGDQKAATFSATPTKEEVLGQMKDARAECDAVFNGLTDADLAKMTGGNRPRPVYQMLSGTVLEHSQEMYGYMAVYLRLKGIVPPSSDRNER